MHDHAHCIARAMAHVDATCAEDGLQMTPVRRRVLQILLEGHRALGAALAVVQPLVTPVLDGTRTSGTWNPTVGDWTD